MTAVLAAFDAVLRIQAADGSLVTSQIVAGLDRSGKKIDIPFWISTKSFDGKEFAHLSGTMLLYTPSALDVRAGVIDYFANSEEATGDHQTLFDWEWTKSKEGRNPFGANSASPSYEVKEDDTTLMCVKALLERSGEKGVPKPRRANLEASPDRVPEVDRHGRWFCDETWA